jgi:ribosomal 30S subunit maturation factor RimM
VTGDRLEVGRIVKAHGIRGEVIVEAVSNRRERFTARSGGPASMAALTRPGG